MNLAGTWNLQLDPDRAGVEQQWYNGQLSDKITLPGSLAEGGYGNADVEDNLKDLTPVYQYSGWAWYQKTVVIPEDWQGKPIFLHLERCLWETKVWVDDHYAGMQNSLATSHDYDLTSRLSPGSHRITIRVDNSNVKEEPVVVPEPLKSDSAALDYEGRDINVHLTTDYDYNKKLNCGGHHIWAAEWNGIIGKIELQPCDPVTIDSCQVYPDSHTGQIKVKLQIHNRTGRPCDVHYSASCRLEGDDRKIAELNRNVLIPALPINNVSFCLELGKDVRLWDEFSPELYRLSVELQTVDGGQTYTHAEECTFGIRELRAAGTQFAVNGRNVYLRGTLECCIFPKTAYPPTDFASWDRIFGIIKDYGLNHVRFHSFCPPKAAFESADRKGVYLQVELGGTSCPSWDEEPEVTEFLDAELARILEQYGNHPSFCLMSMGNEQLVTNEVDKIARHQAILMNRVAYGQCNDPRHLYTCCSHPYTEGRNDDFFVAATHGIELLNGIRWGGPDPLTTSRFSLESPSTKRDYSQGIEGIDRPLLTHEVGQWAVYPDVREIENFDGVLKARNYARIKESLERCGMLDQIDAFVKASGQLSVLLYKEEIEASLRTSGLAGFQLLDLHDFPGQGTSPVGILDVFWNSKGLIAPERFRQFCNETVPLMRMEKYEWTNQEVFEAAVEIAHFGAKDLNGMQPYWELTDSLGSKVAQGGWPELAFVTGGTTCLGNIAFPFSDMPAPMQYTLTVGLRATDIQNSWKLWLYPTDVNTERDDSELVVTEEWNQETADMLEAGANVLLLPLPNKLRSSVTGVFTSVFWNPYFKKQGGLMGLLCDPTHPALADFPTEFHSDWQWWDLIMNCHALNLDEFPSSYRPVVQMIDSFKDNRKLGILLEMQVGRGKLMISTMNLVSRMDERPAARQMRRSLISYMNSETFAPKDKFTVEQVNGLFVKL